MSGKEKLSTWLCVMILLIRREFVVNVPARAAWAHLSRLEQWPSWARHIKRGDVAPPGPISALSSGVIHLGLGMKSRFVMTEFNPPDNWKWVGPFLCLTVHYDHQFEPLTDTSCRLVWIVEVEGFGAAVLGRVFAAIYERNLDRAIPRLIREFDAEAMS